MDIYTHTEAAAWHANEDVIASLRHPSDTHTLLCALADGQGGRSGGATAAQTAVRICLEAAITYSTQDVATPLTWISIGEFSDKEVCKNIEAGFTTLVAAAISPSFLAGVSCGDSAMALRMGNEFTILTENQRKNPPIGSGTACLTPFTVRLVEPWKLLILSDGVWKYLGWERVARLVQTEDGIQLLQGLREAAVESTGGRLADDFSVILVQSGN